MGYLNRKLHKLDSGERFLNKWEYVLKEKEYMFNVKMNWIARKSNGMSFIICGSNEGLKKYHPFSFNVYFKG